VSQPNPRTSLHLWTRDLCLEPRRIDVSSVRVSCCDSKGRIVSVRLRATAVECGWISGVQLHIQLDAINEIGIGKAIVPTLITSASYAGTVAAPGSSSFTHPLYLHANGYAPPMYRPRTVKTRRATTHALSTSVSNSAVFAALGRKELGLHQAYRN
jgi:hypothetical protein